MKKTTFRIEKRREGCTPVFPPLITPILPDIKLAKVKFLLSLGEQKLLFFQPCPEGRVLRGKRERKKSDNTFVGIEDSLEITMKKVNNRARDYRGEASKFWSNLKNPAPTLGSSLRQLDPISWGYVEKWKPF